MKKKQLDLSKFEGHILKANFMSKVYGGANAERTQQISEEEVTNPDGTTCTDYDQDGVWVG